MCISYMYSLTGPRGPPDGCRKWPCTKRGRAVNPVIAGSRTPTMLAPCSIHSLIARIIFASNRRGRVADTCRARSRILTFLSSRLAPRPFFCKTRGGAGRSSDETRYETKYIKTDGSDQTNTLKRKKRKKKRKRKTKKRKGESRKRRSGRKRGKKNGKPEERKKWKGALARDERCALLVLADGGARKTYRMLSFDFFSYFHSLFHHFNRLLFIFFFFFFFFFRMGWNSNFSLRNDFLIFSNLQEFLYYYVIRFSVIFLSYIVEYNYREFFQL